ncbi:unnamed protein product, partial [Gongylonema pulchrum]|uniref:ATPase n=1 Tax=Gongylonema pulchrum TaxID=637853 RepID=A0A183DJ59_9BILA
MLSKNLENEFAQKITYTSQEAGTGHSALSAELSELSSAVSNLRNEFDKLRREKEAKIAEFAHAIMSRDSKQGDDLNLLKIELKNKIKD